MEVACKEIFSVYVVCVMYLMMLAVTFEKMLGRKYV